MEIFLEDEEILITHWVEKPSHFFLQSCLKLMSSVLQGAKSLLSGWGSVGCQGGRGAPGWHPRPSGVALPTALEEKAPSVGCRGGPALCPEACVPPHCRAGMPEGPGEEAQGSSRGRGLAGSVTVCCLCL